MRKEKVYCDICEAEILDENYCHSVSLDDKKLDLCPICFYWVKEQVRIFKDLFKNIRSGVLES